jgi:hypothetical protein
MNDRQRKRHERGQRVDAYMDAALEDFPPASKGGVHAASLKELVAQVAALNVERAAGVSKRREGTEGREEARTALRRMLRSAWETYKTIALDHPDIKGRFETPGRSNNDQQLVTTARAYLAAVLPITDLFTEYGLNAAFFNEMRLKADALEAFTALQNTGVNAGMDATASVEETLRQLDEMVERLDTVVRNKYRGDASKLATWESASRVERSPRHKPEDDDSAPPPPANA